MELTKKEDIELCKDVKMNVEEEGKLVIKGEGKSELMKKIWNGMKDVLKEDGSTMVAIEEAPPTPVKEPVKAKLTVIQEARLRAREKVKNHQEALKRGKSLKPKRRN